MSRVRSSRDHSYAPYFSNLHLRDRLVSSRQSFAAGIPHTAVCCHISTSDLHLEARSYLSITISEFVLVRCRLISRFQCVASLDCSSMTLWRLKPPPRARRCNCFSSDDELGADRVGGASAEGLSLLQHRSLRPSVKLDDTDSVLEAKMQRA